MKTLRTRSLFSIGSDRLASEVSRPHRKRGPARLAPIALLAVMAAALGTAPVLAQNIWTSGGGTPNWSTGGNWLTAQPPTATDIILFDNTYPAVATGVVDNIVDANFTIANLYYQTVSTNGFHTTLIPADLSLSVNGSGGEAVFVGYGAPLNGTLSVYERVVGPGTLSVNNSSGVIDIVQGGDNNDHFATLDLAGLTNFNAIIGQIFVGCISNTTASGLRPMGILRLAETNSITTPAGTSAPGILIASYPTGDTNLRGTQQMLLGRYNLINADAISIGGTKSTGSIAVRPGVINGFVSLRGSAGGSDKVKLLAVGDGRAGMFSYNPGSTSAGNNGTFNSTGLVLDALVQDLYVPRTQTNGSGSATGTLTLDQGSLTTDNLFVGYHTTGIGSSIAANATGTVNVNGTATLTVNNDLILSRKLGSSTPTATLNISTNALVNVIGNVLTNGGTGTINLNGGTLNLQPAGDAAAGYVSVSTLTGSGTITNASAVTNSVALTPGTATALGILNVYSNLTLNPTAAMNVNLADSPAAGNDLVNVYGNLTLNSNNLVLVPLSSSLAAGSYPILTYTDTRTGFLKLSNPTRYDLSLTYPANQVALTVAGGNPGNLRWNGTTSGVWDGTTSNWFNTGSAAADKFFMLDNVLLDDSGTLTNTLFLSGQLFPGSVTVGSSTRDYTLTGSGRLSGAAGLVKNGSSTLTISNQNDFTGPVYINGGVVRLGSGSAFGTAAGGVFITNNATLDLNGTNAGSDLLTISGTGLSNTGAVINTGTRQDNAIRLLSLAADATVGTYGQGRWDVRGAGGNSSFSGLLDLSGYTLTKMGSTQFAVVDCVATNAGSIEVLGGNFAPTRSQVGGPGYVNIYSNMLFLENSPTGYFAKPLIVDGGIIRVTGNPASLWAPVTNLAGGLNIDNSQTFTVTNLITGAGGLTKSSGANLILQAIESYTGPTVVSAGRLTLDTNAAIATTPSITLAGGTVLDASAVPGGLVLSSGQALSGSGTVLGDVTAASGNTVSPGLSAGTLTFSNKLTLNNASSVFELNADPTVLGSNYNDLVVVSNTLTLAGVNNIKIAPLATLGSGQPYTLFVYSNNLVGGAANLSVSSDSRYNFTLTDPASTPGVIQVNVSGSGASANLLWKGGAAGSPNAWDTKVTANWLNGLNPDLFYLGDNVAFDDTASTANVTLAGTEQPAAVGITNSSLNYTFSGAGSLMAGSLAKDGSGSVSFANADANTVSGPLLLVNGGLRFGNGDANTFASGATVNGGSLTLANTGLNTFSTPLLVNGGSVVFNQAADTLFSSVLADEGVSSGTVQKLGVNILTFSGNNTNFNGPIVVSAGTLRAANNYALGSAVAGTTIASGATLDVNGASLYNPGDEITISGTGVGGQGAIVNTGGNQNNALRAVTLAGPATVGAAIGRWDIRGPGGAGSLSGALNLNGFTLTKIGSAQMSIVDSTVTTPGSIVVNGGLLALTRCAIDSAEGDVINMGNSILQIENYSSGYINKPMISSGGTLRCIGNNFTLGSPITNLTGITLDSSTILTHAGGLYGPGALTKISGGTNVISTLDSSWSSAAILGGTLQIGTGGFDGNLPDVPTVNNASLLLNTVNSFTNTAEISGTGSITKYQDGFLVLTRSNSFTGNFTAGSGTPTSGGIIQLLNNYGFGNTTNSKTITLCRCELQLVGPLDIPTNFTFATSANSDIVGAGGGYPAFRNLSGNNVIEGPIILTSGGGSSEFRVEAGQLTFNGSITPNTTARTLFLSGIAPGILNGPLTNNGANFPALTKRDIGTWTLNASNNFSGITTLQGGTLALGPNGSIGQTPLIALQSNATLSVSAVTGGFILNSNQTLTGEGNVAGNVTVYGTVSPGDTNVAALGAISFANALTLAGTTLMEIDRTNTPANADLISAGALTCGGLLVVTNIADPLQLGDTFNLFDATSFAGTFSTVVLPALDPSLGWDLSRLYTDGTLKVGTGVSTVSTNLTWSFSGGVLTLQWPADHTGWRLLVQTNNLSGGISTNPADWGVVPGSAGTNKVNIPLDASKPADFYRMVYP